MAPKKRASAVAPAASGPAKKAARRQAASASTQSASGEEVHITAPEHMLLELANALEQTGRAMPAIRKIRLADGALHISVHDVIVAIKGYNQQNAAQEFKRLGDTYGDWCATCTPVSFADSRGRLYSSCAVWRTSIQQTRQAEDNDISRAARRPRGVKSMRFGNRKQTEQYFSQPLQGAPRGHPRHAV